MTPDRGSLALVLHTHMPYVEGFDTWPFGEEWLWEAIAGVYLPLIELLRELEAPVTLGVTPVLCDQLETLPGPAGERLLGFLSGVRRDVHELDAAGLEEGGERELAAEVRRAALDYSGAARAFGARRDLIAPIRELAAEGPVELWTSAATHALLPLLASDAGLGLQLATGVASHERRFGRFGGGLWLPECAYEPRLDAALAAHGVRLVCVDQTAVHGRGSPEQLEPVLTPAGVVALPIDWQTVELVWSDRDGYPVDGAYRDYHRRTVHDLRPWSLSGAPYDPARAAATAREHARDFVARCLRRLDAYAAERRRPGLLCCALDTELLGHWWYEGQAWLRGVVEEARVLGLRLVTAGEGAERTEPVERALGAASWGARKDFSTWDSPAVAEIAFRTRRAELDTVAAAARVRAAGPALERAARELMALQASDWAFLVTRELASEYALRRVEAHAAGVDAALGALPDSSAVLADARPVDPLVRNLAPDLSLSPLIAP